MFELLFDSLLAALLLYATGAALLRMLRLPLTWCIIGAPATSLFIYAVLGESYCVLRIPATPSSLFFIPLAVLCLLALVLSRRFPSEIDMPRVGGRVMALYVCIGLLFGAFVFVRALPYAGAVFEKEDIVRHAMQIQAFVDSQRFSSLHSSVYQDNLSNAPFTSTSFYPCGWHILCALVEQMLGNGVPVAMNATNYVFASLAYPTSALGLLVMLFKEDERMLVAGSLACMSITAFPWALLIFGPLFPNLAALACVPIVLTFFIHVTTFEAPTLVTRLICLLCFLITSGGMALTHPNAVFSAAVFLIPYCCSTVSQLDVRLLGKKLAPRFLAILTGTICMLIWALLRYSPAFRDVASFNWSAYASPWQALVNVTTFSFTYGFDDLGLVAQPIIAIATAMGVRTLLGDSRRSWIIASHVFACLISMVCMSTEGELKHLLGGFWYTDPFRLAATAAITALPLVACGISQMIEALSSAVQQHLRLPVPHNATLGTPKRFAFLMLVFLIIIPTFTIPGFGTVETAFTNVRLAVKGCYSIDTPYSPDERAFVERAKEVMEEDALVINYPFDGSLLAYGFDDMRCYYRSRWGYGSEGETNESFLIREQLCNLAYSNDVRDAVNAVGAEYVMVLNSRNDRNSFLYWYWHPELFEGITSINEATPGFELILAEDNMRLYRIAA